MRGGCVYANGSVNDAGLAGTTGGVACTTNMSVGWLLTLWSLWLGGGGGVLKTLGAESRCGLFCGGGWRG